LLLTPVPPSKVSVGAGAGKYEAAVQSSQLAPLNRTERQIAAGVAVTPAWLFDSLSAAEALPRTMHETL
jgi:hypothetical protein